MRGFVVFVTLTGCLQTAELSSSPPPPEGPVCGDGICEIGELASCPADCGVHPTCDPTSLGSNPVDLTATTTGAPTSPDFASCGDGADGPMRTYMWTPPATGRYDVTATAAFPVVVDVLQGGCLGDELGCVALSTVPVTLHGGESIAIAVTGLDGASGEFHLVITREPETCGNGACELGEDCSSCPGDCGVCSVCGDGVCNGGETCDSCPGDCGACTTSYCGDGTCDAGEDCNSCASDCGTCASYCGDGSCDSGEDCNSCSADCGSCV
jgi:hypothetical protein